MENNTKKNAEENRRTQWAGIIDRREESGESIREFCLTEGIQRNVYYYWQKKLREAVREKTKETALENNLMRPVFTEVSVTEIPEKPNISENAHTKQSCHARITAEINGLKISADETYPPQKMAELIRGLMQI